MINNNINGIDGGKEDENIKWVEGRSCRILPFARRKPHHGCGRHEGEDETRMRVDINAGYLQTRHRLHHLKKASIGAGDDHLLHVAEAPAPTHSVHSALGPCSKVEIVEVAVDQVGLVCHLPGLHHWGGGLRLC